MTNSIDTPVAIITGAAGGIGKALCETFKAEGYFVVGTVRSIPEDTAFYDAAIALDLEYLATDPDCAAAFKHDVISAIGTRTIKAIINNAAIQILGKTEDLTAADMTKSFNVNTLAPFIMIQTFLSELTASGGSALNIGTVHAQATKPEFAAYATTKTAMHGLTRALAVDLGGRVRVNTLAPAATATPMLEAGLAGKPEAFAALEACHPVGRIADVDEIAKAALFLCSNAASFMTGATVHVDGGVLSRLHDPV